MIHVICANFRDLPLDTFAGVDHVITDPPYSGHVHAKAMSTGSNGRGPEARDFGFACLSPEDREAAIRIMRTVPRWSIVFSDFAKGTDDYEGDPEAAAQAGHMVLEGDCAWRVQGVHAGLEWVRLVPWVRWSQPQITGDRPPTGAEAVLHFHARGKKRWNGSGSLTHYSRKSMRGLTNAHREASGLRAKHPTEKPLALMLDLVSWFTEPGEAILDPFAGAGTTGMAARLLGRDCILVERDEEHAGHAQARCQEGAPLSDHDRAAAEEWVASTFHQAQAEIAAPSTTEPAKRRAEFRIADAARVLEAIT